jgi:hypothetical protein
MTKSTASHRPETGCARAARSDAIIMEIITRRKSGTGSFAAMKVNAGETQINVGSPLTTLLTGNSKNVLFRKKYYCVYTILLSW